MSKTRVVIDANVLYESFARDLLLSLFAAGIYEAKWTDHITKEWVGHLLTNRPDLSEANIARTLNKMHAIPPSALVQRYEQPSICATRTIGTSSRPASPAGRRRS